MTKEELLEILKQFKDEIKADINGVETRLGTRIDALAARTGSLEARVGDLNEKVDTFRATVEKQIDTIDKNINILDERVDEIQDAIAETFSYTFKQTKATLADHELRLVRLEKKAV